MSAEETPAGLPVREKNSDAEIELCSRWMDEHGDPADWSPKIRAAYANTLANMRAGGAL